MSMLVRKIFSKLNFRNNFNSPFNPSNITLGAVNRPLFSKPVPYEVVDEKVNKMLQNEVIKTINDKISAQQQGRVFAIVHVAGKQFKITESDLIIIEGYWPPDIGDKLKLDKVLLVGTTDFTLVGKPLVEDGLVNIHATVIEKSISHTKTNFKKKRRKQYKNINFYRIQQTSLRINSIEIAGKLNSPPEVFGLEHKIL